MYARIREHLAVKIYLVDTPHRENLSFRGWLWTVIFILFTTHFFPHHSKPYFISRHHQYVWKKYDCLRSYFFPYSALVIFYQADILGARVYTKCSVSSLAADISVWYPRYGRIVTNSKEVELLNQSILTWSYQSCCLCFWIQMPYG